MRETAEIESEAMPDQQLFELELPAYAQEAKNRINFGELWQILGLEGHPTIEFEKAIVYALHWYNPHGKGFPFLPEKKRTAIYRKLDRAIEDLSVQLSELDWIIENEIAETGQLVEPDDFDDTSSEEYEGLSYGDFQIQHLKDVLAVFSELLKESHRIHKNPRGKPKNNKDLETTIKFLGYVFEKYTGEKPLEKYRFDPLDDIRPYQSKFFDFLHTALWSWTGVQLPTGQAVGDATRRVFGRRK